jgi:tRNA-splicing ligase RtcB
MPIAILKGKNVDAKLWVQPHEVESSALDQVRNVCSLPDVVGVSIMPDVHTGVGATIGSVIATRNTISPALTGVDIGCGMEALRTSLEGRRLKERVLKSIHDDIRDRIPVGFNEHRSLNKKVRDLELWSEFNDLTTDVKDLLSKAQAQLGSLGGGNHFIELSVDENDRVWIMLHSGSRHIGLQIAQAHIRAAKSLEHNQTGLPDKALAYFIKGTKEYDQYMHDLDWAQRYAAANRKRMLDLITGLLEHKYPSIEFKDHISCHHNYATPEMHGGEWLNITRKGAINAEAKKPGIIPGAMGAKSYIVEGKGEADSFNSAPHGAGRKMSRSKAKKKYRLQDLEETMKGIVCKLDKHTVDEIQYSYKKIDKVMENSCDLVNTLHVLEQIMNIKG